MRAISEAPVPLAAARRRAAPLTRDKGVKKIMEISTSSIKYMQKQLAKETTRGERMVAATRRE